MSRFIEREDLRTTVTLQGTDTLLWPFENRLMSLSLSLMAEIDKKVEAEKERLNQKYGGHNTGN